MANSSKGAGNPLLPIGIIAVVVVAIIVGVFSLGDETPPDEPTIIAEDDIEGEPAGAGTMPEGEADEVEEGITEQVDDVTPAAEGVDTVPAADRVDTSGSDIEGETNVDERLADTANDDAAGVESEGDSGTVGATSTGEVGSGGADGELGDEGAADNPTTEDQSATEEFLLDEETIGADNTDNVDTQASTEGAEDLPEGRDAQVNLDPEPDQDVVRDTDDGGAAFIPTPSGPEGRDDETIAQ
ncbi:hypothetical protein [Palleronia abyssalis]|uniref:Uncharacterized protein n=1 Tax=Palleronia abyssalis TaxID=1501240 RepID=A0A2R8BT39_9RHOB|nr:hypothetical protein [Palleronia abyssalis]SPJ23295.1 hypothetical protein PAA8504_01105 [Palleronia abyssalis]